MPAREWPTNPSIGRASIRAIVFTALVSLAGGCVHYNAPHRAADMSLFSGQKELNRQGITPQQRRQMTDADIQALLDRKPVAPFPAALAVVRVQAPGYVSHTFQKPYGYGQYTVVTTRDIESDEDLKRIAKLPMVTGGLATLNKLVLPANLESDKELRQGAAALHADLLLVYTLDTSFHQQGKSEPLSLITVGLAPNHEIQMVTTASAILMDVRTGYIYATAEATSKHQQMTNLWQSAEAVDESRRKTESQAFQKLIGEFEQAWRGVIRRYARSNAPAGS